MREFEFEVLIYIYLTITTKGVVKDYFTVEITLSIYELLLMYLSLKSDC